MTCRTYEDFLRVLGPEALAAADKLVAEAPPFTPEQRDAIAIILGNGPVKPIANDAGTTDAA